MPKKFTQSERKKAPQKPTESDSSSASSWEEKDKLLKKKQQRKDEQNKKREQQLARKAEAKKLLEEETSRLKPGKATPEKITRVQIGAAAVEPKMKNVVKAAASIGENLNRVNGEGLAARSVDEAIRVLKSKEETSKHREKRRKTAFASFEKRRVEELRTENPKLKLSQMKEMAFKEWQRSPENPMNQV